MPGSIISSSIRSGTICLAFSKPISPLSASIELKPSFLRLKVMIALISESSSIINIVFLVFLIINNKKQVLVFY